MHPVLGKCPICGQELIVSRLDCRACGTEINGQFSIGRLSRLNPEAIDFVEIFIKNRGNAYRVGEELGLPYSTVRTRLTEIIREMGYEPSAETKDDAGAGIAPDRRKDILQDLAEGKISADDAIRLLQGETV